MNEASSPIPAYRLALSVVSHGQGNLLSALLQDLAPYVDNSVQVLVTINVPESKAFLTKATYPLTVIENSVPKGFGANHNQAFSRSDAHFFAVLNPDIRLTKLNIELLLGSFNRHMVGAVAPLVRGLSGAVEDNARRFPSLARILRRVARRLVGLENRPDYDLLAVPLTVVDWVAGMFVLFPSDMYRRVGGFDERYFMYLEDADICRRLASSGYQTMICRDVEVVHDARRATLRRWRHLRWHVTSMSRFFVESLRLRMVSTPVQHSADTK